MVIPCDTAKPLNSFLKSGLTLKFRLLFSVSAVLVGSLSWLLANCYPPNARAPLLCTGCERNRDFCLSGKLEIRNSK